MPKWGMSERQLLRAAALVRAVGGAAAPAPAAASTFTSAARKTSASASGSTPGSSAALRRLLERLPTPGARRAGDDLSVRDRRLLGTWRRSELSSRARDRL